MVYWAVSLSGDTHGGGIMAIEGISSAVNMNSAVSRPSRTAEPQAVASSSQVAIQVEPIKPIEAENGNAQMNSNRQEDRAAVQSDKEISPEKVRSAVDDLNKQIRQNVKHTGLSFKYHDETNRISITVRDTDTDEIIREIPPEKALDMLAKAWEMAGLLVDEKR